MKTTITNPMNDMNRGKCTVLGCHNAPAKFRTVCLAHSHVSLSATPASPPPTMAALQRLGMLRELVLAHNALSRSFDEFYAIIGKDKLETEQQCDIERITEDWLRERAPRDGRDVDMPMVDALLNKFGL